MPKNAVAGVFGKEGRGESFGAEGEAEGEVAGAA